MNASYAPVKMFLVTTVNVLQHSSKIRPIEGANMGAGL